VTDFAANPPAAPARIAAVPKKTAAKKPAATPEKAIALTVRLDPDLWADLRRFLINDRRSANQYIVDLIIADLDPKTKKK
jgi:hypothetical protein